MQKNKTHLTRAYFKKYAKRLHLDKNKLGYFLCVIYSKPMHNALHFCKYVHNDYIYEFTKIYLCQLIHLYTYALKLELFLVCDILFKANILHFCTKNDKIRAGPAMLEIKIAK